VLEIVTHPCPFGILYNDNTNLRDRVAEFHELDHSVAFVRDRGATNLLRYGGH